MFIVGYPLLAISNCAVVMFKNCQWILSQLNTESLSLFTASSAEKCSKGFI